MVKFDPKVHDDNPPMNLTFMAGMQPYRRGRPKMDSPKIEVKIRPEVKAVEHPPQFDPKGLGPEK